ncbi:MAG: twin-arginine translocase TatA/TatE family subunit [Acidimicrobiaceae bacterium]|nr:twin-arginine translocase TatA/TatE family subunit [Acidimicrobiaceae bacterium]MBO0747029.1 twin-arginine translocase TatA/TatE family subunit [Acidimicrobiaceae bacterium]
MFDISPEKIVVVLVIALVVLGPGRLAEAARALGRARAQLRKWSATLPPDTAKIVRNPRSALLDALAEPRQAIADTAEAARQSMTPTIEREREEAKP